MKKQESNTPQTFTVHLARYTLALSVGLAICLFLFSITMLIIG